MELFLSWSGAESCAVASALKEWLPLIFQSINPWLSSSDIKPGGRWSDALASALNKINFGIICLTDESLESPWVLFEAGALSKTLGKGRIVPYLFNMEPSVLKGPFAQFQAVRADKEGTKKLIHIINKTNPSSFRDEHILDTVFNRWWPDLNERLSEVSHKYASLKLRAGQIRVLTTREIEILNLISQGMNSREISDRLYLSYKTIQAHISNMKKNLG